MEEKISPLILRREKMTELKECYEEGKKFMKEEEKEYNKRAIKYIIEDCETGNIYVDWEKFFNELNDIDLLKGRKKILAKTYYALEEMLFEAGYLVYPQKDSFCIQTDNYIKNSGEYDFSTLEKARAFAEAKYRSDAQILKRTGVHI